MCEQNFKARCFAYASRQPHDIPGDFPSHEETLVLKDVFHSKGGPFQRLLDCGGVRYVLLLEFNNDVENCKENDLLAKMYEGFDLAEEDINRCRGSLASFAKECMKLFWPYLKEDFHTRSENGILMDPVDPLDYDRKDSHKLQLKTIEGSVCAIEHDTHLDNFTKTYDNPYPDILCFQSRQVEVLTVIAAQIFRVRIQHEEYALKMIRSATMREIEKLRATPCHPNVIGLGGVLVDAERKVMGILTPFVSGALLSCIPSATILQKEKWKIKISDAMDFLHKEGIIWGDAKPENIIISSATDEPVLIDFEGGQTEGWIDEALCNTREGDLQALPRILKFVDDIPTCEI